MWQNACFSSTDVMHTQKRDDISRKMSVNEGEQARAAKQAKSGQETGVALDKAKLIASGLHVVMMWAVQIGLK